MASLPQHWPRDLAADLFGSLVSVAILICLLALLVWAGPRPAKRED